MPRVDIHLEDVETGRFSSLPVIREPNPGHQSPHFAVMSDIHVSMKHTLTWPESFMSEYAMHG